MDMRSLPAIADHAMLGCLDSTAAPAFEHFAEIDRQAVVGRRHIEPGSIEMARLQT
jgi:hypothetical protein